MKREFTTILALDMLCVIASSAQEHDNAFVAGFEFSIPSSHNGSDAHCERELAKYLEIRRLILNFAVRFYPKMLRLRSTGTFGRVPCDEVTTYLSINQTVKKKWIL